MADITSGNLFCYGKVPAQTFSSLREFKLSFLCHFKAYFTVLSSLRQR